MHNLDAQTGFIETTLRILGDKWTALLLLELHRGTTTFCKLESSLHPISPRTLSQRLDMLEAEGIVERRQYCQHPPRFKYLLTDKGADLGGVLAQMAEWGAKYDQDNFIQHYWNVQGTPPNRSRR